MADHIVPFAQQKIDQIREAGRKSLPPAEFSTLEELLSQLKFRGMTPYINTQLGHLMRKFNWTLEITESPNYEAALVYCDGAFLLSDLKRLCVANNLSPSGDKKTLCGRLYRYQVEDVVQVMQPIIDESVEASYLREGDERRATLVHDRFGVVCSECGFIPYGEKTLEEALAKAKRMRARHTGPKEVITVWDNMAHYGACDHWDADGKCIGYKEK